MEFHSSYTAARETSEFLHGHTLNNTEIFRQTCDKKKKKNDKKKNPSKFDEIYSQTYHLCRLRLKQGREIRHYDFTMIF